MVALIPQYKAPAGTGARLRGLERRVLDSSAQPVVYRGYGGRGYVRDKIIGRTDQLESGQSSCLKSEINDALITSRMAQLLFHSGHVIKPLAMITAYIDESGTHQGSKVLIIGAYIGLTDEWKSVESRFKKADKHSGRIFHAVDCAGGGNDFHGIHKDTRYRLYKKMVKIVNDHDIQGVGTGVLLEDYESVYPRNGKKWEKWLKDAYRLAFADTLIELCQYSRERYGTHPVSFVVEDSQHWYSTAYEVFHQMKLDIEWEYHALLETIAPYSTEEARQLHSADLLAYETYLMKSREIIPTKHGPREPLRALLQKNKTGKIWDAKSLRQLEGFVDKGQVQKGQK